MGRTGRLEDISLLELLGMISIARVTGGLLIKGDSIATINFHLGEMVYAGVEGFPTRLGERMVEDKFLSEQALKEVLLTQQREKPWRPIGAICLEKKLLTNEQLQTVLRRQLVSLVTTILNWRSGIFKFESGEVAVSDPISLSYFNFHDHQLKLRGRIAVEFSESRVENEFKGVLTDSEERLAVWREEFFQEPATFTLATQTHAVSQIVRSHGNLPIALLKETILPLFKDIDCVVELYTFAGKSIANRFTLKHFKAREFEEPIHFVCLKEHQAGKAFSLGQQEGGAIAFSLGGDATIVVRYAPAIENSTELDVISWSLKQLMNSIYIASYVSEEAVES